MVFSPYLIAEIAEAQTNLVQISQTVASSGFISYVPSTANDVPSTANDVPSTANDVPSTANDVPSTANGKVNGIWTQPEDPTKSNCALFASMNIKYIYLQAGEWRSDGSILLNYPQAYATSVANAHAAGLKIYAWIIDDGGNVALSTAAERATAINSLKNLVQTYGFDGIADDIEIWHSYPNLIAFFNEATVALNAIGSEYFTTLISFWVTEMTTAQLASIHVDRLQPMLYDLWGDYEATFKSIMNRVLTYANSPVGLTIGSYIQPWWNVPMTDSMKWVDAQLPFSSTTYLGGIDLFWFSSTDSSERTAWSNWIT